MNTFLPQVAGRYGLTTDKSVRGPTFHPTVAGAVARDHDRDGIHPCEVLSVLVLFVCAIGGLIFAVKKLTDLDLGRPEFWYLILAAVGLLLGLPLLAFIERKLRKLHRPSVAFDFLFGFAFLCFFIFGYFSLMGISSIALRLCAQVAVVLLLSGSFLLYLFFRVQKIPYWSSLSPPGGFFTWFVLTIVPQLISWIGFAVWHREMRSAEFLIANFLLWALAISLSYLSNRGLWLLGTSASIPSTCLIWFLTSRYPHITWMYLAVLCFGALAAHIPHLIKSSATHSSEQNASLGRQIWISLPVDIFTLSAAAFILIGATKETPLYLFHLMIPSGFCVAVWIALLSFVPLLIHGRSMRLLRVILIVTSGVLPAPGCYVAWAILLAGANIWYRAESTSYDQDQRQNELWTYGTQMVSFGAMFVLSSWLNASQHTALLLLPFAGMLLGTNLLAFYKRKLISADRFFMFPVVVCAVSLCFSSLLLQRSHRGAEIIAPIVCILFVIVAMALQNFFLQFGDEESRKKETWKHLLLQLIMSAAVVLLLFSSSLPLSLYIIIVLLSFASSANWMGRENSLPIPFIDLFPSVPFLVLLFALLCHSEYHSQSWSWLVAILITVMEISLNFRSENVLGRYGVTVAVFDVLMGIQLRDHRDLTHNFLISWSLCVLPLLLVVLAAIGVSHRSRFIFIAIGAVSFMTSIARTHEPSAIFGCVIGLASGLWYNSAAGIALWVLFTFINRLHSYPLLMSIVLVVFAFLSHFPPISQYLNLVTVPGWYHSAENCAAKWYGEWRSRSPHSYHSVNVDESDSQSGVELRCGDVENNNLPLPSASPALVPDANSIWTYIARLFALLLGVIGIMMNGSAIAGAPIFVAYFLLTLFTCWSIPYLVAFPVLLVVTLSVATKHLWIGSLVTMLTCFVFRVIFQYCFESQHLTTKSAKRLSLWYQGFYLVVVLFFVDSSARHWIQFGTLLLFIVDSLASGSYVMLSIVPIMANLFTQFFYGRLHLVFFGDTVMSLSGQILVLLTAIDFGSSSASSRSLSSIHRIVLLIFSIKAIAVGLLLSYAVSFGWLMQLVPVLQLALMSAVMFGFGLARSISWLRTVGLLLFDFAIFLVWLTLQLIEGTSAAVSALVLLLAALMGLVTVAFYLHWSGILRKWFGEGSTNTNSNTIASPTIHDSNPYDGDSIDVENVPAAAEERSLLNRK